jgi:hypothetical protein
MKKFLHGGYFFIEQQLCQTVMSDEGFDFGLARLGMAKGIMTSFYYE